MTAEERRKIVQALRVDAKEIRRTASAGGAHLDFEDALDAFTEADLLDRAAQEIETLEKLAFT